VDFIEDGGGSGALAQDSSAFDGLIGQTVAKNFRLVKRIGAGAMGRVYQAEQLSLGKMVAIKILRHELMADEKLVRRFELEARTASAVSHPNLIETFDCGRDVALDLAYIAMELLPGPDLSLVIAREAPLPLPRCARIMDQVLAALEEAHASGIVHRDLKPGNIMLVPRRDEPDFVKVCDFGIAKVKSARPRPSLTMQGLVFGTPEYMSPEQACGGDVDSRTDLYAVGAILYQMVTGHLPFPAPSPTEVLARILRDEPERPSLRAFTVIPDAIEELILRAMSKDRDKRPQSASEFRIAMREAWAGYIDYWPGQNTNITLTPMSLRPPPGMGLSPLSNGPRTPTPASERPTPRAMPNVATPTQSPPAGPAGPATPPGASSGGSNGSRSAAPPAVRRPARAAILGFSLTIACGAIVLLAVNATRGPSSDRLSPAGAAPGTQAIATAPGGGIIVVPTEPPTHGGADARRNGASRGSSIARRDPRANARVVVPPQHQKGGGHHLYDPRAYGAPVLPAEPAIASHAATPAPGDPGIAPPAATQPLPPTVPGTAATVPGTSGAVPGTSHGQGIAHKLRATSIPSEAEVLVDGKVIGKTPLFGAEIDVSQSHTLIIRKDGYAPLEQTVSASSAWVVRASDNVAALRVAAVLQKAERVPGTTPSAQFQGRSSAGAAALASAPPTAAVLAATSHKLRITSIPSDALVTIDGKPMGKTPLFGAEVDMTHPHRLVIRKDGYALFEQTITANSEWSIKPSDPTAALLRISALLKPGDPTVAQNPGP
jgi:serine/threonine protein kinase